MCGIIVSTSSELDALSLSNTLDKRGPDQTRLLEIDGMRFSFHRLAIMDLDETGMQPFCFDNCVLVANAEIYNHQEIRSQLKDYNFRGSSDCEVLLPFYKIHQEKMFSYLDGEFAIVLYDRNRKKVIAARDPI
ncbi:MAG: hypothetical protein PQJ44_05750 [Sphaerochaetaceae bacterium]|nr:hypothetical protein [Sphaerochaetaceae bacterium]